mmetsp:Transcript_19307/g.43799  ORF Transcript_19307/g.43799 Transcript_19307/m.43799 type:complete len:274 (-) Transcript_19307:524-1345(-)
MGPLVGVHVARHHRVHPVLPKQALHRSPHGHRLPLVAVVLVGAVPRAVGHDHQEGRRAAVHRSQVPLEPRVLRRALRGLAVAVEGAHVDQTRLEAVEGVPEPVVRAELGRGAEGRAVPVRLGLAELGPALQALGPPGGRHEVARLVSLEGPPRLWEVLDLVVARVHHDGQFRRERLQEVTRGVPPRLVAVRVRQVPDQEREAGAAPLGAPVGCPESRQPVPGELGVRRLANVPDHAEHERLALRWPRPGLEPRGEAPHLGGADYLVEVFRVRL